MQKEFDVVTGKNVLKTVTTAIAVAGFALFATGCASTNASKLSGPAGAVTKTIVATPAVEKGAKITGEANITKILGGLIVIGDTKYADGVRYSTEIERQESGFMASLAKILGGESNQRAKAAAAYKACEDNNADIILCPSYVLDEVNYVVYSQTKCSVSGYKGVITGIKELETKDYLEMQLKGCSNK